MADTVGNLLGPRATFVYETDSGDTINFQQDRSVGLSVSNALATTSERPQSVNTRFLQGRYILVQAQNDPTVRKRIVVGDAQSALFAADASGTITINTRVFVITGRVGESVSYLRLTP